MSAPVVSAPAAGSIATGSGGGRRPNDNNNNNNNNNKRAAEHAAAATPPTKKAKTKMPCCRCLRSLERAPREIVDCVIEKGKTRCARCAAANRAGPTGCVPLPANLREAASRLLNMQVDLLVDRRDDDDDDDDDDRVTEQKVMDEARVLGLRMRTAVNAAVIGRALPSVPGSARRAPPAAAASTSPFGDIALLVQVLRVGVEMYAQVNNLEAPVWPDEAPSSASSGAEDE